MAQYPVTYSCGHEGTEKLYGAEADRQRKLAWFRESAVCPACYKAGKQAQAAEAAQQQAEAVADLTLAALTGSDKQVAWADKMRTAKIAAVRAHLTETLEGHIAAGRITGERVEGARDGLARMLAALGTKAEASWWIDRRDLTTADFAKLASGLANGLVK